jgi:hypothetical protein
MKRQSETKPISADGNRLFFRRPTRAMSGYHLARWKAGQVVARDANVSPCIRETCVFRGTSPLSFRSRFGQAAIGRRSAYRTRARVIAHPLSICSDWIGKTCDDPARSHHFRLRRRIGRAGKFDQKFVLARAFNAFACRPSDRDLATALSGFVAKTSPTASSRRCSRNGSALISLNCRPLARGRPPCDRDCDTLRICADPSRSIPDIIFSQSGYHCSGRLRIR